MLRSMVLRERGVRGSGEGSEEEERIHWSAREYLVCVWGGGGRGGGGGEWGEEAGEGGVGGGGAGGVTVLRMMSKQQNCHSTVCRSVGCCAYIFHRFFFFFFFSSVLFTMAERLDIFEALNFANG